MSKKKRPVKDPEGKAPAAKAAGEPVLEYLSIDLIDDPERPMRTDITEASVQELVLSMKQVGVIEPLIVRRKKGRYEVIAGHRRLFAARTAKLTIVPCFVREATDDQVEMLKIHENLYREDVKPSDEARHFNYLIQKKKVTPVQIAKLISKSPQYVTDRLAILSWPPFLREAMEAKDVTFSVAREFSRFEDEKQMLHAARYAKRSGMTTEMAKRWVVEFKSTQNPQTGQFTPPSDAPEKPNEVVYDTNCVYCRKGLRLIDAEVVYMHKHCLVEANAANIQNPTPQQPEA